MLPGRAGRRPLWEISTLPGDQLRHSLRTDGLCTIATKYNNNETLDFVPRTHHYSVEPRGGGGAVGMWRTHVRARMQART